MQALVPPSIRGVPSAVEAPREAKARQLVFTEVYREHFGFCWRTARALGTRPPFVEDVVQEIFVVVHRLLPSFEGRSTLRTWLSKIVLNVVRHHRRSVVRKSPHDLVPDGPSDPDGIAAHGPDPYERAVLTEQVRLVQRLLDGLDEDKREVLVLAELEGLTVPEIADALGLKLNTAYSRLRLARKAFDDAVAQELARERGPRA